MDFPSSLDGKESACNAGDPGSKPGEGNGCPSQYSCLENSKDRGTFWATDHVNQESEMTEQLVHTHIHTQTLDIPYPPEIGEVLKVFFFS